MNRISRNTLGAVIALEAIILGVFAGLKMGFSFVPQGTLNKIATLGGNRHIVGTIAALVFIPILMKQTRKGFQAVIVFVAITSLLTLTTLVDMVLITPGLETSKLPVPIAMLVFQILAIVFSRRALQETDASDMQVGDTAQTAS
jgi:hypothetical protein